MPTFRLSLVAPEKLLFAGEVDQVDLPGFEGSSASFLVTRRSWRCFVRDCDGDRSERQ